MKITTGVRLVANRLGLKPSELRGLDLWEAAAIDRAIAAAVRAERKRFIKAIDDAAPSNYQAAYYIKAIKGGK